jgi:hypothetical protein
VYFHSSEFIDEKHVMKVGDEISFTLLQDNKACLCPLLSALCSLLSSLCSLVSALCPLLSALCPLHNMAVGDEISSALLQDKEAKNSSTLLSLRTLLTLLLLI